MKIDIGKEFFHKLINRNELQGDGKYTAIDFRNRFLSKLDTDEWWNDPSQFIELDFQNVEVIGPSWTNEIFAYYLSKGLKSHVVLSKIRCLNLTKTKTTIINRELEQGYRGY